MIAESVEQFIQAVRNLQEVYWKNRQVRKVKQPRAEGPDCLFSESYWKLVEDLSSLTADPNDPTSAKQLVDWFDIELLNLIEEYRMLVKMGLHERVREEAPVVRKPTVDVKLFSERLVETSDEINEKARKVIEKRTKEGYLTGINFAGKKLRPYGIKVAFDLPYDKTVIEALQARSTSSFKGVLDEQGKVIMQQVTEGALNGETVYQIARKIDQSVDGIGRVRATTIARTELMDSVNTAVRKRFESSGVTKLKRHETMDSRICTTWPFNNVVIAGRTWKGCVSIAGKVFSLADAALVDANVHPNERGTWSPYIEGVSPYAPPAEEG